MTGNPDHDEAIVGIIRRIQMARKEPVKVEWLNSFIKGLGYDDPGREIRRLYRKGKIIRLGEGLYGSKATSRPNSINRYC